MKNKNIITASVIVVAIVAVIALINRRPHEDVVSIGAIFPLTGNAATYGETARDGVNLAVEALNSSGGVNGKKVELIYEDSQFDPKVALSSYESLKLRGVKYFLSLGSSVGVALEKNVVADHNLQFEVSAVTPLYRDGQKNTCRATLTADVSGAALGQFIVDTLHAKTISFLTLNDEFGTAMRQNVASAVGKSGVKILQQESFGKNDGDFRTQITKIKSDETKTDALVFISIGPQAEKILKELREFGWSKSVVSDNFTVLNQNIKDLSLAEGIYLSDFNWPESNAANTVNFKNAFKAKYNYDAPVIAANAYDVTTMLAKGIAATGDAQPEITADWLIHNIQNYDGVNGKTSLDSDCEGVKKDVMIEQIKNKAVTPIQAITL